MRAPTPTEIDLILRAQDGERLTDPEMDVLFDAFGVTTEEQVVALAVSRGWLSDRDPEITETQRAYLRAFDRYLRGDPEAVEEKNRLLARMRDEAAGFRAEAA